MAILAAGDAVVLWPRHGEDAAATYLEDGQRR